MVNKRLGIGFADTIKSSTKHISFLRDKNRHVAQEIDHVFLPQPQETETDDPPLSEWRMVPVKLFVVVFCFAIIARLFYLQIGIGAQMRARSDANRIDARTIGAPRGVIYDRNKIALVNNVPAFVKIATGSAESISQEEALSLEALPDGRDTVEVQAIRQYPFKELIAHVLGYTSEVSRNELNASRNGQVYKLGDRIGRSGLEQQYESYLHGEDGATFTEVDATRNTKNTIGTQEPVEGKSLQVAIDINLQRVAYDALKKELDKLHLPFGVVIISQPTTGQVLSLVSIPSYDNNVFSGKLKQDLYEQLVNDPARPFFDRAIGGTYPPGSLYKIVTSAAGLLSGKVTKDTRIEDTGVMRIGPYTFPNWYWLSSGKTDGILNLSRAIARSNDIFFYQVGGWIGQEFLGKTASKMGMGKKTGIDLPGETEGLVPNDAWKRRTVGEQWYPGDTYHMAIGQGYNLVTPMQLNTLTNFVANNGTAFKPQLLTTVYDKNGKALKTFDPKVLYKDILPQKDLQLIQDGMRQACSRGGTGWPLFDFGITQFEQQGATQAAQVKRPITVACKTGTAEYGDNQNRTHAWFTVYAPYQDPEISITVLIESGGEGSNVSAPVAKEILEWYFTNK